jgi:molecular chaperone DnaK (HSP70)
LSIVVSNSYNFRVTTTGKRTIPSIVGYMDDDRLVGDLAQKKILRAGKKAKKHLPNTIYEVKVSVTIQSIANI